MAKITPIALMRDMVKWVTLLWVRLHTKTRHEKRNKFPSHTWLPYFTPNGRVFKIRDFLCMNLSDFVVVDRDILTPK